MNHGGVCRTAPATPGLLITHLVWLSTQVKPHRLSGGSDQYSVLGEPEAREKEEEKEEKREEEFVIDVTESVPKSMSLQSLLTAPNPDILRYCCG